MPSRIHSRDISSHAGCASCRPDGLERILGALLEERRMQRDLRCLVKVAPDLQPGQISALASGF